MRVKIVSALGPFSCHLGKQTVAVPRSKASKYKEKLVQMQLCLSSLPVLPQCQQVALLGLAATLLIATLFIATVDSAVEELPEFGFSTVAREGPIGRV